MAVINSFNGGFINYRTLCRVILSTVTVKLVIRYYKFDSVIGCSWMVLAVICYFKALVKLPIFLCRGLCCVT